MDIIIRKIVASSVVELKFSKWMLYPKSGDYGPAGEESACNAGDTGDMNLISGSGRSCGELNGNPLQYSCLKNPTDRRA